MVEQNGLGYHYGAVGTFSVAVVEEIGSIGETTLLTIIKLISTALLTILSLTLSKPEQYSTWKTVLAHKPCLKIN